MNKKLHSIKNYASRHYKQAGMTLIELTVVLLILIGLAGLLIPYVGSFTQTTHDSTNSNNLAQMNNAVNRYVVDKNRLPPHMDTLINASASAGTGSCTAPVINDIYCGLSNTGLFAAISYATGTNDVAIESLASSGISMAVKNDPTVENKTFGTSTGMIGLQSTGMMAFSGTQYFASVAAGSFTTGGTPSTTGVEKHLAKALGRDAMVYNDTCYDYLAFGLGDNNELVQSTATASPVYFPQDAAYGPTQRYAHLIAIVQVDKDNSTNGCSGYTEKAKFMGVVANVPDTESTHLVGVGTLLEQGWQNKAAGG